MQKFVANIKSTKADSHKTNQNQIESAFQIPIKFANPVKPVT